MPKQYSRGYSLIELVILFMVLAIVSIFILVNRELFFGGPARPQTEDLGVAVIRMGISGYAAQSEEEGRQPVYPLRLDSAPPGTEASEDTPLFTEVVPEGIRSGWRKEGAYEYVYLREDGGQDTGRSYYYEPDTGAFTRERSEPHQVRLVWRG